MISLRITIWTFLLIGLTNCSTKSAINPTLNQEDAQLIEYLFSDFTIDKPGASVLVIKQGKVVHNQSYGLANLKDQTKITPQTNFRLASVTKQFTAIALMILVHQEKLNFQTTLKEVFPDFPDYGNDITIRHLLTHQSGIRDYYDFIEDGRTWQMLDAEVLKLLKNTSSTYFTPGSTYRYSNAGYAVLAQIVEKVSGQSFADFIHQEIFQKLNMSSSSVFEIDKPIANRAYGYSIENGSAVFNDQSVTSAIQGDGGIYMSVIDYAKWDQALYTEKLVPKSLLEDAFHYWENDERTIKEGYGYGWNVSYSNDIKILSHSGGTVGFETWVIRVPSLQLTIAILSNHDGHDRSLMHKVNALRSIYSDYKISMPIEIRMKQDIDEKGVNHGIATYDRLKNDIRYKYDKTTLGYLGAEYRRMQRPDEAIALLQKSTEEFPNYFGGYFGLGRIYKNKGDTDKAIKNFEKVLELDTEEDWIIERVKKELKILRKKNP